jgi:outer membrane protein assembly factor BamA
LGHGFTKDTRKQKLKVSEPGEREMPVLPVRNLFCIVGLMLILIFESGAQTTATNWKLQGIEFEGVISPGKSSLISMMGLKVGQTVAVADLNSAMERLHETGLFSELSYKYKFLGDQLQVTFMVRENTLFPCVFDNFIWFKQEEIESAVRASFPSFQGKAPETGSIIEGISQSLAKLMKDRGLPGDVTYILSIGSAARPRKELIFSIKGISFPICSLQFQGASGLTPQMLKENSTPLLKSSYSYVYTRDYVQNTFPPLYIHHGFWKIRVSDPESAFIEKRSNCAAGVDITISVEEGMQYRWAGARWSGNKIIPSQELDNLLMMKIGEEANDLKIEKGLESIRKAYGTHGHIMTSLRSSPVFTLSSPDLPFEITVAEGPEFRMGKLKITGLSDKTAQIIQGRWDLAPGAVFDNTYAAKLLSSEYAKITTAEGLRKQVIFKYTPDLKTLTVDVEFLPKTP